MALTDEERRHLDELADELAAELTCTDPDLVLALSQEFTPARPKRRIFGQVLILVSVPLAVISVSLVQPIVFASACLALVAAALITATNHRRRPRPRSRRTEN